MLREGEGKVDEEGRVMGRVMAAPKSRRTTWGCGCSSLCGEWGGEKKTMFSGLTSSWITLQFEWRWDRADAIWDQIARASEWERVQNEVCGLMYFSRLRPASWRRVIVGGEGVEVRSWDMFGCWECELV